jgi:hypothetical protein
MPPLINSRYFTCRGKFDEDGTIFLAERDPLDKGEILDGTETTHVVTQGEDLWGIASLYWSTGDEGPEDTYPEDWWWILADLNDIMDGTLDLEPGRVIYVPSLRTVREKVLNI